MMGPGLNPNVRLATIGGRQTTSAGYTLIEMLVALVLMATLLSAVWGIFSLYNSLLTSGRDATSRQQLVRSLFQMVEDDLRRVVVESPSDGGSGSIPGGDLFPSELTGNIPYSSDAAGQEWDPFAGSGTTTVPHPTTLSLTGTIDVMRLTVCRPRRSTEMVRIPGLSLSTDVVSGTLQSVDVSQPVVPEFLTIVYQSELPGQQAGTSSLAAGLYRIQTPLQEYQKLMAQRSTAERNLMTDDLRLTRPTLELLLDPQPEPGAEDRVDRDERSGVIELEYVPEVVGCRFRYFDGDTWRTEWRGDSERRLPVAVSVEFEVVTSDEASDLARPAYSDVRNGLPASSDESTRSAEPSGFENPSGTGADAIDGTWLSGNVTAERFQRLILLRPSRPSTAPTDGAMAATGGML